MNTERTNARGSATMNPASATAAVRSMASPKSWFAVMPSERKPGFSTASTNSCRKRACPKTSRPAVAASAANIQSASAKRCVDASTDARSPAAANMIAPGARFWTACLNAA